MKNTKKIMGMRINELLAKRNKKQKDLAKELEVTDNTISYFVSGSRSPNIDQIIKIADYLNTTTDYLFGLTRNSIPEYHDLGLLLGLSDKAIHNIIEMDWICGTDAFCFLAESDNFFRFAEILAVYLSGDYGYYIPFEIRKEINGDKWQETWQESGRDRLYKYQRDSAYTEFLMAKAIIDMLIDVRKEYDKTRKDWKDELSVNEEDIFNKILADVNKLADRYNEFKNVEHGIHDKSIEDAFKKLAEKVEELESFKLEYAKLADVKKRLSRIEKAIKNKEEYYEELHRYYAENNKEDNL